MGDDRAAEVAMHQPRQIETVLDQHRLIETIVLAQLREAGRIDAAFTRHRLDRIAGDQPDQHEHEQRDPDEGRDNEAEPSQKEPEHAALSSRRREGYAFGVSNSSW